MRALAGSVAVPIVVSLGLGRPSKPPFVSRLSTCSIAFIPQAGAVPTAWPNKRVASAASPFRDCRAAAFRVVFH